MSSAIKAVLKPHTRDIGNLLVRRVLPAKAAWTRQEMGHVPGETEWIPLPEARPR